jgi:hypothetical protein
MGAMRHRREGACLGRGGDAITEKPEALIDKGSESMFAMEIGIFSFRCVAVAALLMCGLCLPREEARAVDNIADVAPHTVATPSKEFTEDDAADAVKAIIAERSKDGVFSVRDSWTGTDLALVFDEVRLVRGLQGHGWFPNVVFHEKDHPDKRYALDFWLVPEGDHLKLMDVRVQKEPKPYGQSWVMITRLPLAWWWLPTMQRSSRSDVALNWQVMSSVYAFVLNQQKDGVYWIRDEKSGKDLSLEFVEVLQPVMRLKSDGRYFVCATFRETSKGAIYDVDFWVDQKSGSVSMGAVEPRKSSIQENATCEVPVSVLTDLYFDVLK